MKKIICGFKEDLKKDGWKEIFWKKYRNQLYTEENGIIYFNSKKYNTKEPIEIKSIELIPNKDLVNKLNTLIDDAILVVKKYLTINELIEESINSRKLIKDIIEQAANKAFYENMSIFDYVNEIFTKCLMKHCFIDGNKRFSVCFLSLILNHFGYFFFWTSRGIVTNYKNYAKDIAEFVCKWENKENFKEKDYIEAKEEILQWIKNNIVVSIP
ncbi:type II toxin-antitoxin system death-on-curing family toxin [Mycoplasmoides alvi]|uniref:type II toxin-antitoxin system death-on-curing family toxin n=1 Tax=Mycoplasmoides alvi TaxID=78580 RepID=UPI00051BBD91|nr:type II toxin-antitoxin system death-on-curing family toxin [Mycoplasmoides alvi]